jgi:gas vesicle protein
VNGLLKFVVGGAVGTAIGLVVASLAAPKKGDEFQDDVRQRLADSKAAGAVAEQQAIASMENRFRGQVGNPHAFTGTPRVGGNVS